MKTAQLILKDRQVKAERWFETLRYAGVTWTLAAKYFIKLRTAHQVLPRIIGFQHR